MTTMQTPPTSPTYSDSDAREPALTGWTAWTLFAGVMLFLAGAFAMIAGLVALFNEDVFLVLKDQLIVSVDYDSWGWIHLLVGALLLVAALSLVQGHIYGRVVAVTAACLSAIINLVFLPAYPVWSAIVIAIDVLVIYAVTVHGKELHI